jgi:hypothetical protein
VTTILAAFDIGTNSVKMTVARVARDGRLDILRDTTRITRLGKNVDATGRLDPEAALKTRKPCANSPMRPARLARPALPPSAPARCATPPTGPSSFKPPSRQSARPSR